MSDWNHIVTAALLGTEKNQQPPTLPAALDNVCSSASTQPREEAFLSAAGAYAIWRRAGWKPPQISASLTTSETEELPPVSSVSAGHLRQMVGGRFQLLLAEWLRAVMQAGRRVPFELLPALLDRARQDQELRPLVAAAGGRRIAWLASQNPNWSFGVGDSPELWETGTREQRVAILRSFRGHDPVSARAKVQEVWKSEPANTRTALLSAFEVGLSMEDEPFLEEALDDRSKDVRRAAIALLNGLPQSRLVARMTARATPLLTFKPGKLLSRASLEVTLPPEPDPAAMRDGLDSKILGAQKTFGEKAMQLVYMLFAVPPRHWSNAFGTEPDKILKAAEKSEFARELLTGWTIASLRFRDLTWAEAILDAEVSPEEKVISKSALITLLPEALRAERLADQIRRGGLALTDHTQWTTIAAQLEGFGGYWPESLAREVLNALRRIAARGIPWHLRNIVERLLTHVPPSLGAEAAQGWSTDQEGVSAINDFLTFRHEALSAIHNSQDQHA